MSENKLETLKERFNSFVNAIDEMDPEEVNIEKIDRLLAMLTELEEQLQMSKG